MSCPMSASDRFPRIRSHRRATRDHRRRRAVLIVAIAVMLGSGTAYGVRLDHERSVAAARRGGPAAPKPPTPPTAGSAGAPTSTPSARSSPHPSATTTPSAPVRTTSTTTSKPITSATTSAVLRITKAYLTGYSYFDNTPPGSASISNPVLHAVAGGTGTYADPITLAVGHSLTGGRDILDWRAGARFYVPNLRRYFIVEDTCGDGPDPQAGPCHVGYPAAATTWLDLWVGGKGGTTSGSNACMDAITGVWSVVINPPPGLATVSGGVYGPGGCTKQYGNTVTKG
jgi:hypothetical protein